MIGHFPRRRQVFIEQRRRHAQRLAGIVEPCLIRRVDRKFFGGPDVHTGQIANRVVVFGITQPVRQHRAGIPGILPKLIRPDSLHPLDHLLAAIRRRLRHGFGRHLLALDPLHQQIPMAEILNDGRKRRISLQVQLSGRRLAAMTTGTILVDEGPDGLREVTFQNWLAGSAANRAKRTAPARYKATERERIEIILEGTGESISKLACQCVRAVSPALLKARMAFRMLLLLFTGHAAGSTYRIPR